MFTSVLHDNSLVDLFIQIEQKQIICFLYKTEYIKKRAKKVSIMMNCCSTKTIHPLTRINLPGTRPNLVLDQNFLDPSNAHK